MSSVNHPPRLPGPPLKPGDLGSLDGMRVTSLLGKGGMAEVYRAEDPLLGETVAIKLIRPEQVGDPQVRGRFLREGRILSAIQNDHVVRIHRVGEANGVPYLVMELLQGCSLDSWMARQRKPVTFTTTCKIARNVLRGLAAIHGKKVVHRDIKPSNLWIDRVSSKVRVLDLGLARSAGPNGSITLEGTVGTAAYMSPEQAEGGELDGRSDLFSLGVVLYQLLTGANPFQKENTLASFTALAIEEPTLLRFCRPDIPPELESFIHGLLAKDRGNRPKDARAAFKLVAPLEKMIRQKKKETGSSSSPEAPTENPDIDREEGDSPASEQDGPSPDIDLLGNLETEAYPSQPTYPFLEAPLAPDDLGSLGGYRVISLIGRGAMGYVFRGVDKSLNRAVAIKVIRPDIASDPAANRRFLRESRMLASLKNEHVVTIYQAGKTALVPYLVMECLEGAPLDVWIRLQGRRLAVPIVVKVARDTLRGLIAIHQNQMVHRDIKPANLWVERDSSRIKVLDFGLTRGPTMEDRSTLTGGILGTPAYMAPEQAAGQVADGRSDLFSLGVVLYEMLAGANPFARDSAVASMNAVAHDVLPSLTVLRKDLPPALIALVESMLCKSPEGRPESAAKALELLLADGRAKPTPASLISHPAHPVNQAQPTGNRPPEQPGMEKQSKKRKPARPSQNQRLTHLQKDPIFPGWLKIVLGIGTGLTVLVLLGTLLNYFFN